MKTPNKWSIGLLPLLAFYFFAVPAKASVGTPKKATIWGHEISYQFIPISNDRVRYDGTAYVFTNSNGAKENRVVLNSGYFKKEAEALWNDFQSKTTPSAGQVIDLAEFTRTLSDIEIQLREGKGLGGFGKGALAAELEGLEHQLQYAAWFETYKQALALGKSEGEAKMIFVREFERVRKATVEFHELSHLLDEIEWAEMARSNPALLKRDNEWFGYQTEVRAFLTELAYGSNPRDSVFQVVAGVVQEVKKGRNVDFSIQKLNTVLKIAQQFSIAGSNNAVACLCEMTLAHARAVANQVYPAFSLAIPIQVEKPAV